MTHTQHELPHMVSHKMVISGYMVTAQQYGICLQSVNMYKHQWYNPKIMCLCLGKLEQVLLDPAEPSVTFVTQ